MRTASFRLIVLDKIKRGALALAFESRSRPLSVGCRAWRAEKCRRRRPRAGGEAHMPDNVTPPTDRVWTPATSTKQASVCIISGSETGVPCRSSELQESKGRDRVRKISEDEDEDEVFSILKILD